MDVRVGVYPFQTELKIGLKDFRGQSQFWCQFSFSER